MSMQSLLSHLLLWAEFEDAIKEGRGSRVLRCWKFLLFLKMHVDAIEGITLLALHQVFLSPHQKEQLPWSRFVNYTGKPGANKATDLHIWNILLTGLPKLLWEVHGPI